MLTAAIVYGSLYQQCVELKGLQLYELSQQWVHEGLYSYSKKYEEHTSVSNTELK